ncbi:hypothetical protein [Capnocytophaga cynodegmi]|uniref:hypothetical protein n=1 Tax=Capnocytophaga cynodegmi TaxID=28189 RepID=UPI001AD5ED0E|nr:hypothetical protein [Capnocytophaga cynodegmi]GIM55026.1 glycosyl transferase [Capnocytophaga cynodegmi]
MKKILYIMHIPWGWIKQRPHFFAEHLSNHFQIDVLYKTPLKVRRENLKNQNNILPNVKSFFQFPFKKFKLLRNLSFLNKFFIRFSLSQKKIETYDYVWITSLSLYPMISHLITHKTKLIWDCMDDELEFKPIKENKPLLSDFLTTEKHLMERANLIICSSEYLSKKIQLRSSISREISIINNAIELPSTTQKEPISLSERQNLKLNLIEQIPNIFMYIGSISEWFDFESILKLLEANTEVNIVLVGPNDITIPKHKRIFHLGTVKREHIFLYMEYAKALIMPFKVDELIKSVNPVKIYEYIYTGKPILAPYYEEMHKFAEFVHLYNNTEEFIDISAKVLHNKMTTLKNQEESRKFVEENQWKNRCQQILKILPKVT